MFEEKAYLLGNDYYFQIQTCDDGWDYTIYYMDGSEYDGGQLDNPEMSMEEATKAILEDFGLQGLNRMEVNYYDLLELVENYDLKQASHYIASFGVSLDEKIADATDKSKQQRSNEHYDMEEER